MGQSSQEKAAGEASRTQAQLASELWGQSKGPLSEIFQMLQGGMAGGYNQTPELVKKEFADARQGANLGYDSAIRANRELAGARARTSGQVYSTGELDSAISQGTWALNQNRESALRNLNFQEAQAGMGQWNNYLSMMGQGANTALGLGGGFAGAGNSAISQMQNGGGWGGALQGAAGGAAAGASFGGWGAVIGGVLGGAAGYMG